ncbi:MAG TPA: SRPBCC family protein [Chthoniobacterales bacterium]
MEGVEEVRQLDDKRLHWRAQIWGKKAQWDAEIYEQFPDRRIAWQSISGHANAGAVSFTELAPDRTRVNLVIQYQPLGATEKMGEFLGIVAARVEGDLETVPRLHRRAGHRDGRLARRNSLMNSHGESVLFGFTAKAPRIFDRGFIVADGLQPSSFTCESGGRRPPLRCAIRFNFILVNSTEHDGFQPPENGRLETALLVKTPRTTIYQSKINHGFPNSRRSRLGFSGCVASDTSS